MFESLKYLISSKGETSYNFVFFSLVTVNFVTLLSSFHIFTYIQAKKCHDKGKNSHWSKKRKKKTRGLVTWWYMLKKIIRNCTNRKEKGDWMEWSTDHIK